MTLTTRLSLFFLAMLALVLAGFSVLVCLLAQAYLDHRTNEALRTGLDTLAAAAEIGPRQIEWEPNDRRLTLSTSVGDEPLRWLVNDERGQTIDHSPGARVKAFFRDGLAARTNEESNEAIDGDGRAWRFAQRKIEVGSATTAPPDDDGLSDDTNGGHTHRGLSISAAVQLEPAKATLRNLAMTTGGVSVMLWSFVAFVGQGLCRRALRPVVQMADAAQSMNAAEMDERLPLPGTGDELEQFARTFNRLLDRLQESFARQRRFTGDASHQLRTPLAGLLGQIELALRRDREPDEYRRVLQEAQSRALELQRLIESLLFLARADADALLPDLTTFDLRTWLCEHLAGRQHHPRTNDVHLDLTHCDECRVEVQGALLAHLIDNLLDNACKYSAPGSEIVLRVKAEPRGVVLSIEDRGCGIADDELPHVFEPFYRSPRAREAGLSGTGLGLAVAARIATAMGGHVDVESQLGQGSCFRLYLPRADPGLRNRSRKRSSYSLNTPRRSNSRLSS